MVMDWCSLNLHIVAYCQGIAKHSDEGELVIRIKLIFKLLPAKPVNLSAYQTELNLSEAVDWINWTQRDRILLFDMFRDFVTFP